jgi:hypothetical protein
VPHPTCPRQTVTCPSDKRIRNPMVEREPPSDNIRRKSRELPTIEQRTWQVQIGGPLLNWKSMKTKDIRLR